MDENILKFRVGIFVVIAMCILGILISLNSEGWVPQYTVFLNTRSAPGVTKGTPIRKNGILIGRVKEVKVIPGKTASDQEVVSLRLAINEGVKIYENETCSIGSDSILGDASIEFLLKAGVDRGQLVDPNSEHLMDPERVEIAPNPMKLVSDLTPKLSETLDAIKAASVGVKESSDEIHGLTNTIRSAFQDDESDFKQMIKDFHKMTVNSQSALEEFEQFFVNANGIIGDPNVEFNIKLAIQELLMTFQEVRVTVQDTREVIQKFGSIPDRANENLDNMKEFTQALKEQGPDVINRIHSNLKNIEALVSDVKGFTGSLGNITNSKGSLGKFINDPELYNSLLMTARKIQREIIKIEPTINDIRMFTDAIARDPGVLGLRGAMDRRPGKTGYKGSAGRDGGLFK